MRTSGAICTIGLAGLLALGGAARSQEDFYAGKQIQFVIRSQAGSGYDQYSRLLGKYMSQHLPGAPTMIYVNMPGSGGLTAANYVAARAPRDGTVLTMVGQGLPADQALGLNKSLQADMNAFNWIGNVSATNQLLITWHTSKIRTLKEAQEKETVFGAAGAGSISVQLPAAFNALYKTQFKIIMGYPGTGELLMAMERGEIDGADFTWGSLRAMRPDFMTKKLVNFIVQIGLAKESALSDIPLMSELAKTPDEKSVSDYITKSVTVGRPVATTPGVPPERVALLRRAFDAAVRDPGYLHEAETQNLELKPMSGQDLQQLVRDLLSAPPAVLDLVRHAMQVRG
jgi:tripartite-type tricarboxylate transporter receptor subunit TctC